MTNHTVQNPPSIATFLKNIFELKKKPLDTDQEVHYVLGNESADLDSISCAIGRAYLLQNRKNNKNIYLPIINIPREDLALRKDAKQLIKILQISPETLLFEEDLPQAHYNSSLRIDLVDHNALTKRQKYLEPFVSSIVDHHVDEEITYPLLLVKDKLLATVGSAATLVSYEMMDESEFIWTPDLAALMLAPILVDTSNLKDKAKTTLKDKEVAAYLQTIAGDLLDLKTATELQKAKVDMSGFTIPMILKKDLKYFQEASLVYSISSIPANAAVDWVNAIDFRQELAQFVHKQDLDLGMILTTNEEERHFIIYTQNAERLSQLQEHMQYIKYADSLELIEKDQENNFLIYKAPKWMSRKILQPCLQIEKLM
ncbi:MAG: hypothetical protein CMO81_04280 [Waddliaceae bacterium]|nr:hypothetical protein [Waddliaceae bacterium]